MFKKARLKLTLWYLVIIMFISLFFSLIIYKGLTLEIERFAQRQQFTIERRLQSDNSHLLNPPTPFLLKDPDLVNEAKNHILIVLIEINLGILTISGLLGYVLAGKTLKPIAIMVDEQNRFISDASHELRTPLTALKTSMEVGLRDKKLNLVSAKKIIEDSVNETNKLQSLSDNLLKLASYETNNSHQYFKEFYLKEVINEVIKKLNPLAKEKRITIKKNLSNVKILANKDEIMSLITIFIDNAIKYSFNKGEIEITVKKIEKNAVIAIKDFGLGIDKKNLPYIFDRFYRADMTRTKNNTSGFGLGLSIAKKIVENHKGKINVESLPKKGSLFIVTIPISS